MSGLRHGFDVRDLRRIKISRPGFVILSNPYSLSPQKKREHNNAWRQRQHDTKNDRLNCSHRSPRPFDSANLLLARSACIVGSACQSECADPRVSTVPEQRDANPACQSNAISGRAPALSTGAISFWLAHWTGFSTSGRHPSGTPARRMPEYRRSRPARNVGLSLGLEARKRRMVKPGLSASPAVAAVRASSSEPCKPRAAASAKWVRGELRPQCFVGTNRRLRHPHPSVSWPCQQNASTGGQRYHGERDGTPRV
jgi:hypothetical protein